jgi:hypothetical protein
MNKAENKRPALQNPSFSRESKAVLQGLRKKRVRPEDEKGTNCCLPQRVVRPIYTAALTRTKFV